MSTEYRQRYFDTLLAEIDRRAPIEGLRVIGEISVETARQPHIALFAELGPARCVATTAGLSARPMPLPVSEGFQYFELCALTKADSPKVLWLLSNLGRYMLAIASPFFFGDRAEQADASASPRPLRPCESLALGGDGSRFLFVPRFEFFVPQGPPVEVVEPLPITAEQWAVLGPQSLDERGAWVAALGARSRDQWDWVLAY